MYRYPLLALLVFGVAAAADRPIATGWTAPESADYQAGIDRKIANGGHPSIFLKSLTPGAKDYAARQRIRADLYHGKRVRLSGWVKPDHAEEGGALWMRVDMKNGDYILDGMLDLSARDRAGRDTDGWTRCVLVSDVPAEAIGISFGLRMKGKGEIWAGNLTFEAVGQSVPATTIERRPFRQAAGKDRAIQQMRDEYTKAPLRPVNLGLENP